MRLKLIAYERSKSLEHLKDREISAHFRLCEKSRECEDMEVLSMETPS